MYLHENKCSVLYASYCISINKCRFKAVWMGFIIAYLENQLQRKKNKKLMFSHVSLILLCNFIYIVYLDLYFTKNIFLYLSVVTMEHVVIKFNSFYLYHVLNWLRAYCYQRGGCPIPL